MAKSINTILSELGASQEFIDAFCELSGDYASQSAIQAVSALMGSGAERFSKSSDFVYTNTEAAETHPYPDEPNQAFVYNTSTDDVVIVFTPDITLRVAAGGAMTTPLFVPPAAGTFSVTPDTAPVASGEIIVNLLAG